MVKFGKELEHSYVPEWQPYYCSYSRLRVWIDEMESNATEEGATKFRAASQSFFEELKLNLARVDAFYATQEKKAQRDYERLCTSFTGGEDQVAEIVELQERLVKLTDFGSMNTEGFRKIAKKFDKKVGVGGSPISPKASTKSEAASLFLWAASAATSSLDKDISSAPRLQEYLLESLPNYSFAQAEERLAPFKEALQATLDGETSTGLPIAAADLNDEHLGLSRSSSFHYPAQQLQESLKKKQVGLGRMKKAAGLLRASMWLLVLSVCICLLASANLNAKLTPKSWLVIWVVLVALVLLIKGAETDGVMMGGTLLLNVTGVLTQDEAWAAFSNDVVLAVASLGGISSVLGRTGVIDAAFGPFLGSPTSYRVALFRVAVPTVLFNVGISNTCVMSCLMPVVEKWSADIGIHQAMFLMPISYLLLVSGLIAMFSTSTNLVCQGQLASNGYPQFDQFALAIPGLVCTVAAVLYLMVVVPIVLHRFDVKPGKGDLVNAATFRCHTNTRSGFSVWVQVVGHATAGHSLETSGLLSNLCNGIDDVLYCERYGESIESITPSSELKLDDIVYLRTSTDSIVKLQEMVGVKLLTQDQSEMPSMLGNERELVKVVLGSGSPLIGHPLHGAKDRAKYGSSIVAYRPIDALHTKSTLEQPIMDRSVPGIGASYSTTLLRQGDSILFSAPVEFYPAFRDSNDFIVVSRVTRAEGQSRLRDRLPPHAGPISGGILMVMILLVATATVPLLQGVFLALVALIMTSCTTLDDAIKAVKLRTVCVIVGAFGLGKAIGKEHVADVLAEVLIYLLAPLGATGFLAAIFMATVALGIVFHGTAVVILMFPVCEHVADQAGIPIHQVMGVLCLAACCQLLSPISYQTNLMAFSAGGYEFADFTRVGAGLVIVVGVLGIPMCQWCFPA